MSVISLLEERARRGTADLAWIVLKVSRRNIIPQMVEQITLAKSGISWMTLQVYIEQPQSVSILRIQILERKLQGIFRQLQVIEFLRSLDPGITLRTGENLADIIAIVSRDVEVPGNWVFNHHNQRVENQVFTLRQGQRLAVKAVVWYKDSYSLKNVEQLCQEIQQISSELDAIVVVTDDFLYLKESKQQAVTHNITANGGKLIVLDGVSARDIAQNTAQFLYDLSR